MTMFELKSGTHKYVPGRCSCSFPVTITEYCDPNFIRQDSRIVDYWWDGDNFHIVNDIGQEYALINAKIIEVSSGYSEDYLI